MYFPFFRCKQNELLAIRECIPLIRASNICVILEPVRENLAALKKCLKILKTEKIKFILIVNPSVGELEKKVSVIHDEIIEGELSGYNNFSVAYIISDTTSLSDIRNFIKKYNTYEKCLVHLYSLPDEDELKKVIAAGSIKFNIFNLSKCGDRYIEGLGVNNKIALRDDFRAQVKNANYPEDEYFSELCFTYAGKFLGYGDFTIVGEAYSDTGGPAYVVTIHLTYPKDDREIRIKHFSSKKDSDLPINPGGKFLEALNGLNKFLNSTSRPFRDAVYQAHKEFNHLHDKQHFPGLGAVKKIAMKHHMEVMADVLKKVK